MCEFATIDGMRTAILAPRGLDPVWAAKMLQTVPDLPTVPDRAKYLTEKALGQVVLDLGCTGPISQRVRVAATGYHGVDRTVGPWDQLDLDREPERLPIYPDVTLILISELIEHLSNPGRCLEALRAAYPTTPCYVTVPQAGAYRLVDGREMVHPDHVAYYSYTTLLTLLRRHGFVVAEARWYHGEPHKAEGLIVLARGQ